MLETFTDLAEYVWDFYSPKSDLYPIKGLTMEDALDTAKARNPKAKVIGVNPTLRDTL